MNRRFVGVTTRVTAALYSSHLPAAVWRAQHENQGWCMLMRSHSRSAGPCSLLALWVAALHLAWAEQALMLYSKRCRLPLEPYHLHSSLLQHLLPQRDNKTAWMLANQSRAINLAECIQLDQKWHAQRCRDRLSAQLETGQLRPGEWPFWPHHRSVHGAGVTVNLHGWHVSGAMRRLAPLKQTFLALGLLHLRPAGELWPLYRKAVDSTMSAAAASADKSMLAEATQADQEQHMMQQQGDRGLNITSEWVTASTKERLLVTCVDGHGLATFSAETDCLECIVHTRAFDLGLTPIGASMLSTHVQKRWCADLGRCAPSGLSGRGLWQLLVRGWISPELLGLMRAVMIEDAFTWPSAEESELGLVDISVGSDGRRARLGLHDPDPTKAAVAYCQAFGLSVLGCDNLVQVFESAHSRFMSWHRPVGAGGYLRARLLQAGPGEVLVHPSCPLLPGSWAVYPQLLGGHVFVNDRPLIQLAFDHLSKRLAERAAGTSSSESLMVDVGANTGSFSLLPALLPGLRCVSFEPVPQASELLRLNLAANAISDRVLLHQAALAATNQPNATIQVPVGAGVGSGLATLAQNPTRIKAEGVGFARVPVEVGTLDGYLSASDHDQRLPVDLLKIDVEGFELYVLQGARETIKRHRPALLIEVELRNMQQAGVSLEALEAEIDLLEYRCMQVSGADRACKHQATLKKLRVP